MRSSKACVIHVVLLVACTRENPDFNGSSEGDDGATSKGTTSSVTSGGANDDRLDTGATAGDATAGDPTAGDPTAGDPTTNTSGPSEGTTAPSGSESGGMTETGGVECTDAPPPTYGLAADPSFEHFFMGCGDEVGVLRIAMDTNIGGVVMGQVCIEECPCMDMGEEIMLTFDVLPPPTLRGCFTLEVQLEPLGCQVLAYAIRPGIEEAPPLMVVSTVLQPLVGFDSNLMLGDEPTEPCDGCEEPPSGRYALVSSGDEILPDGIPVEIPSLPGYEIVNDGSGIDSTCEEVVRWHATWLF